MNSRDAISTRKGSPPFLIQVSVNWRNFREACASDCGGGTYAEGKELDVGVLVAQPSFESAHGVLGLNRLGPYLVAYLKIESNVFGATWQKLRRRLVYKRG